MALTVAASGTTTAVLTAGRVDAGCVTSTVTNPTTVLDASAVANDVGRAVAGAGIPAGAYILSVVVGVSFTMNTAATASATVSLTIGNEQNVEPAVTPGTPSTEVYEVSCENIQAGEVVFLRLYGILLAGGVEQLIDACSFIGGSDVDPIIRFDPIPTDVELRCSVQQQNGTGRTFPWKRFTL